MGTPSRLAAWFIHRWDATQVELRGRYSAARLREVAAFAKSSSWTRNVAIVVLTPLPAVLLVLFLDALPLQPTSLGVSRQTVWLYVRLWFVGFYGLASGTWLLHHSSPSLPLSMSHLLLTLVPVAMVNVANNYIAWSLWVFPTPFAIQLMQGPFVAIHAAQMWWRWRDTLQRDPVARTRLHCFFKSMLAQGTQLSAYMVYYAAFTLVGANYRTYVSLVLPILRLAAKNAYLTGLVYLEDETPAITISSVDTFHAMFVCTTMQQAKSMATTAYIIAVDVVQALLAHAAIR